MLPGNNRRARHYTELALALSAAYSVHVLDRRGRGDSGPQGRGYGIESEVDDALAVMAHTGSVPTLSSSIRRSEPQGR